MGNIIIQPHWYSSTSYQLVVQGNSKKILDLSFHFSWNIKYFNSSNSYENPFKDNKEMWQSICAQRKFSPTAIRKSLSYSLLSINTSQKYATDSRQHRILFSIASISIYALLLQARHKPSYLLPLRYRASYFLNSLQTTTMTKKIHKCSPTTWPLGFHIRLTKMKDLGENRCSEVNKSAVTHTELCFQCIRGLNSKTKPGRTQTCQRPSNKENREKYKPSNSQLLY